MSTIRFLPEFEIRRVLIAACLLAFSATAPAAIQTTAAIHSADLVITDTDGGLGVLTAAVSGSASDSPVTGVTRDYSASAYASAPAGRTGYTLSSSIELQSGLPSAQLSMGLASINNRVIDTFLIGAGGSGLSDGDSAQIRLQIALDGIFQVGGRPSGIAQAAFEVRIGEISGNNLVADYNTGGLNPPQDFEVDQFWDILVDVTVGEMFTYDMLLSGWLNGTAYDPGQSGTNFLDFDGLVRVSHAAGFESLDITSEAGATIAPIPIPAAAWLFGSAIGLLGWIRRRQNCP